MNITRNEYPRIIVFLTNRWAQTVFALVTLCILVVFNASAFIYRPYDGLSLAGIKGNEVFTVNEGGPADQAGIQTGDKILTIDNKPIDPWQSSPLYRPNLGPGDPVVYQIQRGEQILTLSAVMGSHFQNPSLVGEIVGMQVLSVIFWIVGLVLCLFAMPGDIQARLAGLVFLLAGVAVASGGPASMSYFWGSATTMKIAWVWLGFLLITQHLYFPAPAFSENSQKRIIGILATVTLVLTLVVLVDDAVFKAIYSRFTGLNNLVYLFFLVAVLVTIGLLFRSRWSIKDPDCRRQAGIILWAMALGFAPFLLLTLVPSLMLMFGETLYVVRGYLTTLFLGLVPLAYAYVIYQRKLLKVDLIINRLVVFFIIGLLVFTTSFLTFLVIGLFIGIPYFMPLIGSSVAVLVALPLSTLRNKADHWVSNTLYGTYYDHASVAGSMSSRLAQTLDRATLVNLLTEDLAKQMGIQQKALLLTEGDHLSLQPTINSKAFSLSLDDELCQAMLGAQAPVRAQSIWGSLQEETQDHWQQFAWGELFAPIIFENHLQGVLILGSRTTGDIYSEQDLRIIATVAHQGALASANVQLIETLRGLSQQLVRAGEAERKQLARELHDGVLQNLVFVRHKIRPDTELGGHLDDIILTLRRVIKAQRPSSLDRGLAPALEDLVGEMRNLAGENGPKITWHNQAGGISVPDEQATAIFRIAQESISNAIRHARATNIDVSLVQENGTLVLAIEDDGSGMLPVFASDDHYGLVGMRERAIMIGADLRVISSGNEGTKILMEYQLIPGIPPV